MCSNYIRNRDNAVLQFYKETFAERAVSFGAPYVRHSLSFSRGIGVVRSKQMALKVHSIGSCNQINKRASSTYLHVLMFCLIISTPSCVNDSS